MFCHHAGPEGKVGLPYWPKTSGEDPVSEKMSIRTVNPRVLVDECAMITVWIVREEMRVEIEADAVVIVEMFAVYILALL